MLYFAPIIAVGGVGGVGAAMTMFLTACSYVRSVVGPSTAAIIYGSVTS